MERLAGRDLYLNTNENHITMHAPELSSDLPNCIWSPAEMQGLSKTVRQTPQTTKKQPHRTSCQRAWDLPLLG